MKVFASMDPRLPLVDTIAHARRVEDLGYDGLHVAETVHDAFSVSLLALEHTDRIVVRTSVALAFVCSPTLAAYGAWDLAMMSANRFELGLGTQIRQNIEERYGVPFGDDPVARLRDFVGAVRAAFDAFETGNAPDYTSDHYRVTRMQPYFNPGPGEGAAPRIVLGGVQRRACELAGEIADGYVSHPTNSSPLFLEQRCLPALTEGARRAGRTIDDSTFDVIIGTPVVTGATAADLDAERERQRRTLAFLYSTPAYAPTLDLYGWSEVGPQLRSLVREDRWGDLTSLLTDEMFDVLVPCAPFGDLASVLLERFGHLGNSIVIPPPADERHDQAFAQTISAIRSG